MYVQKCVKGIAGGDDGISEADAKAVVCEARGICSNWLRRRSKVSGAAIREVLTLHNLNRHLREYEEYGPCSPFISLASGAVEREASAQRNVAYSAIDTALSFATGNGTRPGALFYLWVAVGHNAVVSLPGVAEPVRDLNIYQAWSPYQTEGEIAAKIHISASQIERVEWWDFRKCSTKSIWAVANRDYVRPELVNNVRELF